MSKFKKIFIILFIIIFCLAIYYPVNFFLKQKSGTGDTTNDEKYSGKELDLNQSNQLTPQKSSENNQLTEEDNIIENLLNNETPISQTENSSENLSFFINITPPDCIRECEPYKYNAEELQYCQNICGLSPVVTKENCEKLEGLEKDYCIKNNAIIDKDLKQCNEIIDIKLKESCQKRVQEDFIETNF